MIYDGQNWKIRKEIQCWNVKVSLYYRKTSVCDVLLPLKKVLFIFKSLGYQAGCDQSVFYKLQNDKKLNFS